MPRPSAITLRLTPAEQATLRRWRRATTISRRQARRGHALLLVAAGVALAQVARVVGLSRPKVYKWVWRFQAEGLAGLVDRQRGPARRRGDTEQGRRGDARTRGRGDAGRGLRSPCRRVAVSPCRRVCFQRGRADG